MTAATTGAPLQGRWRVVVVVLSVFGLVLTGAFGFVVWLAVRDTRPLTVLRLRLDRDRDLRTLHLHRIGSDSVSGYADCAGDCLGVTTEYDAPGSPESLQRVVERRLRRTGYCLQGDGFDYPTWGKGDVGVDVHADEDRGRPVLYVTYAIGSLVAC